MFVYIHARFRFALIGGNLTAQSTKSHGGFATGGRFQASFPFLAPSPERPGECNSKETPFLGTAAEVV